jgi:uncharacterized membrane protein (UPF0127 family)
VFFGILEVFFMKIYNSTQNNIIAEEVKVAENFFTRSVGLLSRKYISENEALIIKPCCSIHTFFMKFEIDVLFVGANGKVISLYENVKPWRILPIHLKSQYVIELCAGQIRAKSINKNDNIEIEGFS